MTDTQRDDATDRRVGNDDRTEERDPSLRDSTGTSSSDSGNDHRDTRRRRRRGRRGGRGGRSDANTSANDSTRDGAVEVASAHGASDVAAPDADSAVAPDADSAVAPSGRAGAGGPGHSQNKEDARRSKKKASSSGGSRRGGGGKTGDDSASGGSNAGKAGNGGDAEKADKADKTNGGNGDADVEASIAKDGTRIAAKKSGRRNGGSGRRGQQRPGGVPEEVRRAILEGPPRTMLVTAKKDRTQIAVLEDRSVVEHYVTRNEDVTYVGNMYMARVQNVLPGMEAAFLDIGKGRNGVLYAGEVLYDELDLEEGIDERIENALKPGQKVLVQVTKDPMVSKGPRLTMHLSLAGRYLVLAPNSELFGISRKLTEKERDRLRRIVKRVKPAEHGVIVRTAAEGASEEQIAADVQRLLKKWEKVAAAAEEAEALAAVYEEPPLVVKVIRDTFGPEFERCIVDDEDLYRQVCDYLGDVAPELLGKVELYGTPTADAVARAAGAPGASPESGSGGNAVIGDPTAGNGTASPAAGNADEEVQNSSAPALTAHEAAVDAKAMAAEATLGEAELAAAAERRESLPALFEAYDVAEQLRKAMGKKVWLPSGGYLIIEVTEAMKVIDVNTGKFTGGKDTNLEEVVLKTNLEAADEIVRQLRLRDMGGIIVIDFIDMLLKANQDQVVRRLKRELLRDRTKTRVSEVSRLGLVQMTRKNVSQGLVESFSRPCEVCDGRGVISELE